LAVKQDVIYTRSSMGLATAFSEIPAKEAGKRRISSRMNVEVAPQTAFFQAGRRPGMAVAIKKSWMNEGGPGTMGFPRVGGFQRVSDQTLWPWREWEGRKAASRIPPYSPLDPICSRRYN